MVTFRDVQIYVFSKHILSRLFQTFKFCCICAMTITIILLLFFHLLPLFQVLQDQVARSSMRSGKMRTYIPPFYASFLTSLTTSSLACRQLERTSLARVKNPSKGAWCNLTSVCSNCWIAYQWHNNSCKSHTKQHPHCMFYNFTSALLLRFVSISKNYRSVIRACMEELQQVAGNTFENMLLLAKILSWCNHKSFGSFFRFLFYSLVYTIKTQERCVITQKRTFLFCSFYQKYTVGHAVWKSGKY